jgi:hypothetical protein
MASPAPQRDLQAEITNFVSDHLRKSADANVSGLVADYAERVDYYDDGVVDRSFIVKDRQTFAASWPSLKITPPSGLRITETPNRDRVAVSFDYRFDARNNSGSHSSGNAANVWILDTSSGGLKIVSEKKG